MKLPPKILSVGLLLGLLLLLGNQREISAQENAPLNANCNEICKCSVEVIKATKTNEFRVVCDGNGSQGILLTDSIFSQEPKPELTRNVYVRLNKFTEATVDNSFLSRWLAYTSCSFDIWSCGQVLFSQEEPVVDMAITKLVFTGIGISDSNVNHFPPGILRNRNSAGIKVIRSTLESLKLDELAVSGLSYLQIKDSSIGLIEGAEDKPVSLVYSISRGGTGNIKIHNSRIGYLRKGSLAIRNSAPKLTAKINIENTTFGIIETGAIQLGKSISLKILGSNIGSLSSSGITFLESQNLILKKNIIGVVNGSLTNLKCEQSSVQIYNNLVYHSENIQEYLFPDQNKVIGEDGNEDLHVTNFFDPTCAQNKFVQSYITNKEILVETTDSTTSPTTTTASTTSSTFTTTTTTTSPSPTSTITVSCPDTTPVTPTQNQTLPFSHEALYQSPTVVVPLGIFYLAVSLCLFLLLMVTVLLMFVVWGKLSKKKTRNSHAIQPDNFSRNSDIYEQPPDASLFMLKDLPSVNRCSKTYEETETEFDRYQNLSAKTKEYD